VLIGDLRSRACACVMTMVLCTAVGACGHRAATPELSASPPTVNAATSGNAAPVGNEWQALGSSVQGRPIRSLTLGHGPRKVLLIGGIHGDEPEGAYATAQLPVAFAAANLAGGVTLTIIEDANPDGRAAVQRGNANGVDINRNFPASNFDTHEPSYGGAPLSQPESRLLFDVIDRINPALVLVFHSWVDKQFINFDGPARVIAERFSTESGMPLTPSSEFGPTPGSLGSYVGRDRQTPVLTIEFLKGSDSKADWERVRSAVLNAIAG